MALVEPVSGVGGSCDVWVTRSSPRIARRPTRGGRRQPLAQRARFLPRSLHPAFRHQFQRFSDSLSRPPTCSAPISEGSSHVFPCFLSNHLKTIFTVTFFCMCWDTFLLDQCSSIDHGAESTWARSVHISSVHKLDLEVYCWSKVTLRKALYGIWGSASGIV